MVIRYITTVTSLLFSIIIMESWAYDVIVVDSATHVPLPNASIYDKNGTPVGLSNRNGAVPKIPRSRYPITVRYLGFNDKTVMFGDKDTIFLSEKVSELPEVVVKSGRQHLLHILAYVREYSTLATYTDTIFLFREKMVDYMLPSHNTIKFKGWSYPRVLTSKSYYRFTNNNGLDSVSDVDQHHFSWSDWIGMPPEVSMPLRIRNCQISADTLCGKYSPTEIWHRSNERIRVDVDVLADPISRKWVPGLTNFFQKGLDYEKFKVTFNYDNVIGDSISKLDLDRYSFSIESKGRGREMFRFNKINVPFFVSTNAEVYILDKEYITVKEAKKWDNRDFDVDEIGIYEPLDAPPLSSSILDLIERICILDKEEIRLDCIPDHSLMGHNSGRQNFRIGRRALLLLKQVTGITLYKSHKNFNNNWNRFRKEQIRRNKESNNED